MRKLRIWEMIGADDYVIVVNNPEERDSFVERFNAEERRWDEGGGGSAYEHDRFPIYLAIDMFGWRGVYSPDDFKMIPNIYGPGIFKYANWNDMKDIMVPDDYDAVAVYESDPEYQRRKNEALLEDDDDDDDDDDGDYYEYDDADQYDYEHDYYLANTGSKWLEDDDGK